MSEPLDVASALVDVAYVREVVVAGRPAVNYDLQTVLAAAEALAAALERVDALQPGRIGAGAHLAAFDANDIDSYSFYQGVSFALARVRQVIKGGPA